MGYGPVRHFELNAKYSSACQQDLAICFLLSGESDSHDDATHNQDAVGRPATVRTPGISKFFSSRSSRRASPFVPEMQAMRDPSSRATQPTC